MGRIISKINKRAAANAASEKTEKWSLSKSLPYLLNRVGFRIIDEFEDALSAEGITVSMWRVLAVLNERGPCKISDLAGPTSLDSSTLSRLLKQLERMHFVKRKRSADDERVVDVSLTDRGAELFRRIEPSVVALERDLEAGFTEEDVHVLRRLLTRMYGNVIDRSDRAPLSSRSA